MKFKALVIFPLFFLIIEMIFLKFELFQSFLHLQVFTQCQPPLLSVLLYKYSYVDLEFSVQEHTSNTLDSPKH